MRNIILFFFPIFFCFWYNSDNCANKVGTYTLKSVNDFPFIVIKLKGNGLFYFETGDDLSISESYGNWRCKKDTVYLTSKFQNKPIPLSVTEKQVNRHPNHLSFELTDYLPNKIRSNIQFKFRDTTVFVDLNNKKKYSSVNITGLIGFKIFIGENLTSQFYQVTNPKSNHFIINIDAKGAANHNVFLKEEKFLFKESSLFKLDENNNLYYALISGKKKYVQLRRTSN